MKFRRLVYMLVFTLALTVTGCKSQSIKEDVAKATKLSEESVYEKVHKTLLEMETYRSDATVEYISNKGSNTYDTLQQCRTSGEYRIEVTGPEKVQGNVTLSDGSTIYQFNPKISAKVSVGVKESQERSEIFLTSFVKNYLQSQEVSISVANFGDGKCTVLEASIPGGHPYLATEKLWVDNKTLRPVKLVVFDPDGGERIIVTYKTFEYNIELTDELFTYQ